MNYLSELHVLSPLILATKQRNAVEREAYSLIKVYLKQNRPYPKPDGTMTGPLIDHMVPRMLKAIQKGPHTGFLEDIDWLVPVPSSTPRMKGAFSAPLRIAEVLLSNGIGNELHEHVVRTRAVARSSQSSSAAGRTNVATHVETMATPVAGLLPPGQVLLVDDVVTMGSTMIGAASRLASSFSPPPRIRAFAMARVDYKGLKELRDMLDPLVERVVYQDDWDHASRGPLPA